MGVSTKYIFAEKFRFLIQSYTDFPLASVGSRDIPWKNAPLSVTEWEKGKIFAMSTAGKGGGGKYLLLSVTRDVGGTKKCRKFRRIEAAVCS